MKSEVNSIWAKIPLGDVLKKSDRWTKIQPNENYKQITVRLWGKGVILRREVTGAEISASEMLQVLPKQFILSRIDARNGASGLIPEFLNGAVVSNDFPVYDIDTTRLLPAYIGWMSKTRDFVDFCKKASEGTTNRVRLKEDRFLGTTIPLPSLKEQRRTVAKIDELSAKIREACRLRQESVSEAKVLIDSVVSAVFNRIDSGEPKALGKLTSKIGSGSTPLGGRAIYLSSGIPFIRSLNVRMRKFQWNGIAFIDTTIHRAMGGTQVKPNDVLLNITGASIGRVACAPPDLIEGNVSQHVAIIRPLEILNPRYLMYWLSQPQVQDFINSEQKGATRQGFTKAQIEKLKIPLLTVEKQLSIVSYLDDLQVKAQDLEKLQTKNAAEFDALLPSILDKAFKGEL